MFLPIILSVATATNKIQRLGLNVYILYRTTLATV